MAKKETNKKDNIKNKKSFSKDFKAELKKVVWPTPKQLVNNTVAVITIVLITAVIVFILDFAFEFINKQGVEKVKSVISTQSNVTSEDNSTSESDDVINEEDEDSNSTDESQVNNSFVETENVVDKNDEDDETNVEVQADQNN